MGRKGLWILWLSKVKATHLLPTCCWSHGSYTEITELLHTILFHRYIHPKLLQSISFTYSILWYRVLTIPAQLPKMKSDSNAFRLFCTACKILIIYPIQSGLIIISSNFLNSIKPWPWRSNPFHLFVVYVWIHVISTWDCWATRFRNLICIRLRKPSAVVVVSYRPLQGLCTTTAAISR